jgi:hypothetical protein
MTCQSNLRQIAVVWGMYLEDNKGRFHQDVISNVEDEHFLGFGYRHEAW